jgi:hypothetical protein
MVLHMAFSMNATKAILAARTFFMQSNVLSRRCTALVISMRGVEAKMVMWDEGRGDEIHNDYPRASGGSVTPGRETLFLNAAIMDRKYQATNIPWIVILAHHRAKAL